MQNNIIHEFTKPTNLQPPTIQFVSTSLVEGFYTSIIITASRSVRGKSLQALKITDNRIN